MFCSHLTKVILAGSVCLLPSAFASQPDAPAAVVNASAQPAASESLIADSGRPQASAATPLAQSADAQAAGADSATGTQVRTAATPADTATQEAEPLPQMEADRQDFDLARRQMTASGNVLISQGDVTLRADNVVFNQPNKLIIAEGDVTIADGPFRFLAPDTTYGYEDKSFGAGDFRLGTYPLRAKGKSVGGTPEKVSASGSRVYFNEPDAFALNLGASKVRITDGKIVELDGATFYLGAMPFFYLPGYSFDATQEYPVSFNVRVGYSKSMGAYLQTQTLIRMWEGIRLGANLDGYTARGVLAGPAAALDLKWGDGSFITSSFDSGYIDDNGGTTKLGVDMLGRPIDRNRFFIDWQLLAGIGQNVDIISSMNWWSDSEVTRDFREELFRHNQTPDNYLEGVYRGENFIVSNFVRYRPNAWEQTATSLPAVGFNLMPTEILNTGIYQRLDVSYARLEEKDPLGAFQKLDSNRLNAYYSLSRTFSAKDWFSFTPVVGTMVTYYGDTAPGAQQGSYTRMLGEFGFDAQMLFNGRWDVQNKTWGVNGLRHLLRPIVQYRYIPAAQSGDTLIPDISRQDSFQTYLSPIGLADRRSIDDMYAQNTLRIGLENVLQTRADGNYGSRQLAELNIYQQFNFIREPAQAARYNDPARPRQDTFSDLYTELKLTPAPWLNSRIFTRIDPNGFQLRQISSRHNIIDSDKWSVYVGNDYIEDTPGSMINQYVFGAIYRLNDRNRLTADWRVDGQLSEVTEQYYGWQTMLGHSWLITTQVGYITGSSRNNNFQFRIRADLKLF